MFVVFEGLIGSGKSTMAQRLQSLGWTYFSPPDPIFDEARKVLDRDERALEARHLLFLSALLFQNYKIVEAIGRGEKVICDSWFTRTDVTHAALGSRVNLDLGSLTIKPDLIIFLDCSENSRTERQLKRANPSPYWKDQCELHSNQIRTLYFEKYPEMICIDSERDEEIVFAELKKVLEI